MIARFDSVQYVARLKAEGFSEQQCKAMADALAIALGEAAAGEIATKEDFSAVKIDLKIIKSDNKTIEWLLGILMVGMFLLSWKIYL